jgi:hypothetical protein
MRRHRDQKLLDRARRQANTKQAKLDRKRRQHLIERSFADASNLHGFKRARWRGLIRQSIQDLLIATVQNLRKLLAVMRHVSENGYHPLTEALFFLRKALAVLSTLIYPLAPMPPRALTISPAVRATRRRNGKNAELCMMSNPT